MKNIINIINKELNNYQLITYSKDFLPKTKKPNRILLIIRILESVIKDTINLIA